MILSDLIRFDFEQDSAGLNIIMLSAFKIMKLSTTPHRSDKIWSSRPRWERTLNKGLSLLLRKVESENSNSSQGSFSFTSC